MAIPGQDSIEYKQHLEKDRKRAESEAARLRAMGTTAYVIPLYAQVAGERVLVGYNTEVRYE